MSPGEIAVTITAGEYCRVMDEALRRVRDRPELQRERYQPALRNLRLRRFSAAVASLADLVKRRPDDQLAHWLLGIVHPCRGNLRAAAEHLEVARDLLKKEGAAGETLQHSLRVRCEEALVRYVLVSLYMKMGRLKDARALMMEEEQGL